MANIDISQELEEIRRKLFIKLNDKYIGLDELDDFYQSLSGICERIESVNSRMIEVCGLYIKLIVQATGQIQLNLKKYMDFIQSLTTKSQLLFNHVLVVVVDIILDPSENSSVTLDLIKYLNSIVGMHQNKISNLSLWKLMDDLCIAGDYEYQVYLLELIFRLCASINEAKTAEEFFPENEELGRLLMAITKDKLEKTMRNFLNVLNCTYNTVLSIQAEMALTGKTELTLTHVSTNKNVQVWIDFNTKPNYISIQHLSDGKCSGPWNIIKIFNKMIHRVNLEISSRHKDNPEMILLTLQLNEALISHLESLNYSFKDIRTIKLLFSSQSPEIDSLILSVLPAMFPTCFEKKIRGKVEKSDDDGNLIEVIKPTNMSISVKSFEFLLSKNASKKNGTKLKNVYFETSSPIIAQSVHTVDDFIAKPNVIPSETLDNSKIVHIRSESYKSENDFVNNANLSKKKLKPEYISKRLTENKQDYNSEDDFLENANLSKKNIKSKCVSNKVQENKLICFRSQDHKSEDDFVSIKANLPKKQIKKVINRSVTLQSISEDEEVTFCHKKFEVQSVAEYNSFTRDVLVESSPLPDNSHINREAVVPDIYDDKHLLNDDISSTPIKIFATSPKIVQFSSEFGDNEINMKRHKQFSNETFFSTAANNGTNNEDQTLSQGNKESSLPRKPRHINIISNVIISNENKQNKRKTRRNKQSSKLDALQEVFVNLSLDNQLLRQTVEETNADESVLESSFVVKNKLTKNKPLENIEILNSNGDASANECNKSIVFNSTKSSSCETILHSIYSQPLFIQKPCGNKLSENYLKKNGDDEVPILHEPDKNNALSNEKSSENSSENQTNMETQKTYCDKEVNPKLEMKKPGNEENGISQYAMENMPSTANDVDLMENQSRTNNCQEEIMRINEKSDVLYESNKLYGNEENAPSQHAKENMSFTANAADSIEILRFEEKKMQSSDSAYESNKLLGQIDNSKVKPNSQSDSSLIHHIPLHKKRKRYLPNGNDLSCPDEIKQINVKGLTIPKKSSDVKKPSVKVNQKYKNDVHSIGTRKEVRKTIKNKIEGKTTLGKKGKKISCQKVLKESDVTSIRNESDTIELNENGVRRKSIKNPDLKMITPPPNDEAYTPPIFGKTEEVVVDVHHPQMKIVNNKKTTIRKESSLLLKPHHIITQSKKQVQEDLNAIASVSEDSTHEHRRNKAYAPFEFLIPDDDNVPSYQPRTTDADIFQQKTPSHTVAKRKKLVQKNNKKIESVSKTIKVIIEEATPKPDENEATSVLLPFDVSSDGDVQTYQSQTTETEILQKRTPTKRKKQAQNNYKKTGSLSKNNEDVIETSTSKYGGNEATSVSLPLATSNADNVHSYQPQTEGDIFQKKPSTKRKPITKNKDGVGKVLNKTKDNGDDFFANLLKEGGFLDKPTTKKKKPQSQFYTSRRHDDNLVSENTFRKLYKHVSAIHKKVDNIYSHYQISVDK